MDAFLRGLFRFVGHILIIALCVVCALMLSGRLIRTEFSLDGINIDKLSQQRAIELILTDRKQLVATTYVTVMGRTFSVEGTSLIWLFAMTGFGLLIVYLPGVFWEKMRPLLVRIGISILLSLAVVLGA